MFMFVKPQGNESLKLMYGYLLEFYFMVGGVISISEKLPVVSQAYKLQCSAFLILLRCFNMIHTKDRETKYFERQFLWFNCFRF